VTKAVKSGHVLVITVKLLLAPAFIVAASLTARRFGMLIGGTVAGLPGIAGPILLAFALEQGPRFAAHAAVGTLLGLIALTTFVVAYAWLAGHWPWPVCLLTGWAAFIAVTVPLSTLNIAPVPALMTSCAVFLIALRVLPHSPPPKPGEVLPLPPSWDLAARATSAILLVLILTSAASALGPALSGLLAPFPIIASILAAFTHAHNGPLLTRRILRGLVLGFFAFALFCFTLAQTVDTLGIAAGFAIAAAVALLTQALVLCSVVAPRRTSRVAIKQVD
jgi:hypothetical protein